MCSAETMSAQFERITAPESLHARVTRTLGRRVVRADKEATPIIFPSEGDLCAQLGVSRTILREALKVLADKGMVEVRPRSGMRSLPRSSWKVLDPDILAWQSEENPDAQFLRDVCEILLAIEPTAAGFAAVRATAEDIADIEAAFERRVAAADAGLEEFIELELRLHRCIISASHNRLFQYLSDAINEPFRAALFYAMRNAAARSLEIPAHEALVDAIRRRDPLAARSAADSVVANVMVAVEHVIRRLEGRKANRGNARVLLTTARANK
jgi:GntR family transcriptional regulator, galactonate operon transcriptional repressor